MKKIITAIVVLACSATMAFAHPGSGHLAQKLNLSDAQKAQWQEVQRSFRQENKAFLEQARATMRDFRAARDANDTAKVESLKPVVQANREQLRQLREAQDQKLMAILNAEQQAQFQQLKAERQGQHRRRP